MERKTTKSHIQVELPDGRVTTIKELMRKYDDNKDGKIGRTELGNLLTDCNEGKRPSEEEIEYFHRIADMHDGHADGTLERNDLEYAINCWKAYLQHQSEIDEAFDKYDQDKNGMAGESALYARARARERAGRRNVIRKILTKMGGAEMRTCRT